MNGETNRNDQSHGEAGAFHEERMRELLREVTETASEVVNFYHAANQLRAAVRRTEESHPEVVRRIRAEVEELFPRMGSVISSAERHLRLGKQAVGDIRLSPSPGSS